MIIVNSFDYRSDDEPRYLLQLWIQKGSKDLVLYISEHLRILYRSGLSTFSSWCIDILVTQIYSMDLEITQGALNVLKEVCENDEMMYALLKKWPQIDKLELGGDAFISRFLRTEFGAKFFQEFKWIEPAISRWLKKGNFEYVDQIEKTILAELNIKDLTTKDDNLQLHIPIDCALDVRNETKVFRRLPFVIIVKIETAFKDTYYASMLQTYLQTDETLNFMLIGKVIGKNGLIQPLKIENAHIISSCLRLGSKCIDNFGRPVNEEFWARCDYNDRRNVPREKDFSLTIEKNGVTFYFTINKDTDALFLNSITYQGIDKLIRHCNK